LQPPISDPVCSDYLDNRRSYFWIKQNLKILIVFTNIAKEKKVIFISSISLSGHSTLFPGLNTFHHRCHASDYPLLPLKQQRDNGGTGAENG